MFLPVVKVICRTCLISLVNANTQTAVFAVGVNIYSALIRVVCSIPELAVMASV